MEIFDMVVMTAFVGYIFSDVFGKFNQDPLHITKGFNWESFKFAAMVTAPALILHELAHKFVGMGFGMQATFHAAYVWLVIGLVLKLMNFPFLVFVPAFVSIKGGGTPGQFALIAFAGPAMNLLLWLGLKFYIQTNRVPGKHHNLAVLTREVNKFLFIFNMIPIPGFDGFQVFSNLAKILL